MNTAFKLAVFLVLLLGALALAFFLWLSPSKGSLALEPNAPAATKPVEPARDTPRSATDALAAEQANSERASMPKEAKNAPAAKKPAAVELGESRVPARRETADGPP